MEMNYLYMKNTLIAFIICLTPLVSAQSLTSVIGLPEGFASMNGGVTGGQGGPVVTVTTAEELSAAVDGANTATIILVKGTINVVGEVPARGNKTIVGLGTDACIFGSGFGWNTKSNVIVQNITFGDAPDDLLKINNKCMNFWIDHCTFSDGADTNAGSHDGMLDVTRGSQYVTISYNKFFNHDKNILIGHSDSETGDTIMKVTLHHNWFDKTIQRNPRVRFATVHCYNNYYVANSIYSVASAINANVLVENCYFKNAIIPLQVGVPGFSPAGYLVQRGCYFENCGIPQLNEKDMTGLFPYLYKLDSVMYVPCIAETYVGAAKPSRMSENFNCTPVVPVNAISDVAGKVTRLSFNNNILTFSSKKTCPAQIKMVSLDGRTVDIPFRGWVESDVENKLQIHATNLPKGVYLLVFTADNESSTIKIQR
jgi:pectate lyase